MSDISIVYNLLQFSELFRSKLPFLASSFLLSLLMTPASCFTTLFGRILTDLGDETLTGALRNIEKGVNIVFGR